VEACGKEREKFVGLSLERLEESRVLKKRVPFSFQLLQVPKKWAINLFLIL
jgi:hypothetical protein